MSLPMASKSSASFLSETKKGLKIRFEWIFPVPNTRSASYPLQMDYNRFRNIFLTYDGYDFYVMGEKPAPAQEVRNLINCSYKGETVTICPVTERPTGSSIVRSEKIRFGNGVLTFVFDLVAQKRPDGRPRIDSMAQVLNAVNGVRADVNTLRGEVNTLRGEVNVINTKVENLRVEVAGIRSLSNNELLNKLMQQTVVKR